MQPAPPALESLAELVHQALEEDRAFHDATSQAVVPASAVGRARIVAKQAGVLAGRAYAAYGGVYIAASLAWLWGVEGVRPDRWDSAGAAFCLIGAAIILFGPRAGAG